MSDAATTLTRASDPRRFRVLLVEDDAGDALLVRELLDRTIRLAIERRLAERGAGALAEATLRPRHNDRLVSGLATWSSPPRPWSRSK